MRSTTRQRQRQYHIAYMNMAIAMAQLSHANRKKVGCIIVSPNDQVVAQGYNGMPKGFANECEYEYCLKHCKPLSDVNYWDTECCREGTHRICSGCEFKKLKTNEEVLHAESNAIAKCAKSTNSAEGCTLYVTMSPCINCAKTIIQAGISRVIFLEPYGDLSGVMLLEQAGIEVQHLDVGLYESPMFITENMPEDFEEPPF